MPGDEEARNELPPISDWPKSRSGTDTVASPATAGNAPPPSMAPGAGGMTGSVTTARPPTYDAPTGSDAGAASPVAPPNGSGASLGGGLDAGIAQGADSSADAGVVDAGPALGASDAGCIAPIAQDAGVCGAAGCHLTRDPLCMLSRCFAVCSFAPDAGVCQSCVREQCTAGPSPCTDASVP